MTTLSTSGAAPRPRSRGRARIVVATLTAFGFAALAWASFVSPLPRLTYNPSDSVAVGWYRVDPLDRRAFHYSSAWARLHRRKCASLAASSVSTACLRPPCCEPTGRAVRCHRGSSAAVLNPVSCSC